MAFVVRLMHVTKRETIRRKQQAVREAEASGQVADSMDVRLKLIERMNKGELTLAEVQAELKRIKASAKRTGQITRSQAYRNG